MRSLWVIVLLPVVVACAPVTGPEELPIPTFEIPTFEVPQPGATPTGTAPEVQLPATPPPIIFPPDTPQGQAQILANAVALDASDRLAGWLAVYDALGIPVIDENGNPVGTTGDDPIGPPYWRVWYMSGMSSSGYGFPLTAFVKIFAEPGDVSFDAEQFGATLLEDLRAAAFSNDPQVRLFGLFVTEVVKQGPGQVNLRDPAVTADQVVVSGDMAELLFWVVIRGLVFSLAESEVTSFRALSHVAHPNIHYVAQQVPCSEIMGDEDVTTWFNWVINKLGGGFQLPGMTDATKGIISLAQEYLGVSKSTIDKTTKITGKVGVATAALSLAMLLSSLELSTDMGPDPLVRTKSAASDGNEATIFFRLTIDPGRLPDGNNLLSCVSSFLLNALGVSLSFPTDGAVPGAELVFEGGQGFGQGLTGGGYVQFADYRQLRQDTDNDGLVSLEVQGKAQERQKPANSQPFMREFSIHVSGQPEAVTGQTIANIFFGGLSFGASPSAEALINAILDIVKTFHWDLGEHVYRLQDWTPPGWHGTITITQTITENYTESQTGEHGYSRTATRSWEYRYQATIVVEPGELEGFGPSVEVPEGDYELAVLKTTAAVTTSENWYDYRFIVNPPCTGEFIDTYEMSAQGAGEDQGTLQIFQGRYTIDIGLLPEAQGKYRRTSSTKSPEECLPGTSSSSDSGPVSEGMRLGYPEGSFVGAIDPNDPTHISGSRSETETSNEGRTTTTTTVTWDLTRSGQ